MAIFFISTVFHASEIAVWCRFVVRVWGQCFSLFPYIHTHNVRAILYNPTHTIPHTVPSSINSELTNSFMDFIFLTRKEN